MTGPRHIIGPLSIGTAVGSLLLLLFPFARAEAQYFPEGSLDFRSSYFLFGGASRPTTRFGSLSLRLFQGLRRAGRVEGDLTLFENEDAFGVSRATVALRDYPLGDYRFDVLGGDISKTFSIFSEERNFLVLPYLFFRGAEVRAAPARSGSAPPPLDLSVFGGRVAVSNPLIGSTTGGFGGESTLGGLFGALRLTERAQFGLGLTHVSADGGSFSDRTNLQLEAKVLLRPLLQLLASYSHSFTAGKSGGRAGAWRLGPAWRKGIVKVEAYVRQNGSDFLDVPGKFVSEQDSRGAVTVLEITPRTGPALYASGQLLRTNLENSPSRPRLEQKSASLQLRFPVPRGSLVFQGSGSRLDSEQPGSGESSTTDFLLASADWSFPLSLRATGNLGVDYRRQGIRPASENEFDAVGLFGRVYGFQLGTGSLFATGRLERRFPSGLQEDTWQWEAFLGAFQRLSRTELRGQIAYNSAETSFLASTQRTERLSTSLDIGQRLGKHLLVSLGGTYQRVAQTRESGPRNSDWQIRASLSDFFHWGRSPRIRPGYEGVPPARGAVLGRVYLDHNENALFDSGDRGLPAIGIRLGQLELTASNSRGDFAFTEVPDGTYRLSVVLRTLSASFDSIPTAQPIVVKDGGTLRKDFRIVRVGIVRGRVSERVRQEGVARDLPREGSIVRLIVGSVELETTTEEDGRYSFESVPPGNFEVNLHPESLPERARVLPPESHRGVMVKGAEETGKDFLFEIPPIPEEIIRFPQAAPKPGASVLRPPGAPRATPRPRTPIPTRPPAPRETPPAPTPNPSGSAAGSP